MPTYLNSLMRTKNRPMNARNVDKYATTTDDKAMNARDYCAV